MGHSQDISEMTIPSEFYETNELSKENDFYST